MMKRLAGLIMLCCVSDAGAHAQDVGVTFAGKQMKLIVGVGPGGSNSLYAEALSRHMGKYLPGEPAFVLQHMPGANGLMAANYIANKAARDGTEFTIVNRTAAVEPLLGNANAMFDARKLTWLGSANVENSTCIAWAASGVSTFNQLFERKLVAGGTGADALEVLFPRALNRMLGTRFDIVNGYGGSPQVLLAMEKGEVEGFCGIGWTYLKLRKSDWVEHNRFNILFQMALDKHPDLPDIPLVREFARNDDERAILDFMLMPQNVGRPFFAPELPGPVASVLQGAFARTLVDPEFLADAERTGLEVQLVDGATAAKTIGQIYATPPALVQRAKALIAP